MATILVVEDERMIAQLLQEFLEEEGYRVVLAEHGRGALHALELEPVDLILSDLMMPVMDGWRLYEAAQAHHAWRTIPYVIMSAISDRTEQARCPQALWLRKPFDIDELLARLKGATTG
jgi:CheY-like chemotaxis protein